MANTLKVYAHGYRCRLMAVASSSCLASSEDKNPSHFTFRAIPLDM